MDAVDEGDKGGSLSRECKLPLEPFERGSVGDSALNASPWLLVRRSSAIFWRRSSGGGGSGGFVAILSVSWRCCSYGRGRRGGPVSRRCAEFRFTGEQHWVRLAQGRACSELSGTSVGGRLWSNQLAWLRRSLSPGDTGPKVSSKDY